MKTIRIIIYSATLLLTTLTCIAQPVNEWRFGFGQGTEEYFVDNGPGNRIYIACPSNMPASIQVTIMGKEPNIKKGEKLTFIIDSVEYRNEFENKDCRVCAANFIYFWDKLRNAKSLSVKFSDSLSSEFSVKKIKQTLAPLNKTQCKVAG